jgi:hypothetical protein
MDMTRLVLMIDLAGAGRVTEAGFADIALYLDRQLVWGPLPSAVELMAFFAPLTNQERRLRWQDGSPAWRVERAGAKGLGLAEYCATHESVALWVSPLPNAQLSLIWLLDYLCAHKELLPRLTLAQADCAGLTADEMARMEASAFKLLDRHLVVAGVAWNAYRAPTPQGWRNLLDEDLAALPQLRQAVVEMLEELPSPTTGLGATEMRILELIAEGDKIPSDVFPGDQSRNNRRVYDYWEFGEVLDGLVRCPAPAVSGLSGGPFSVEMLRDRARSQRYEQSKLSLTPLGRSILAGTEDFSHHNPVDRWWGGTHLTNQHLWRWDPNNKVLVAP